MAVGETFTHIEVTFHAFVGTENVDRRVIFRELTFTDEHDYGSMANIVNGMDNSGWEIHDVVIHTENDCAYPSIKDTETLAAVFEALYECPDQAGQLIAYGELFGWWAYNFEDTRYGRKFNDGYYGVFDNEEEFTQEFVENDTETEFILSHPYISIDWETTTRNLMNDFATYDYGYEVYIFANH